MIKLLIGGSPCTYWSIAQKNNRETKAEGLGWELFKNYLIAKEKFNPDYFLYENNKSAAEAIKRQIREELQVYDGTLFMQDSGSRYIEIDSALVSAQHRERFYVHNCGEVEQPEDRGILLRDILERGVPYQDKAYCVTAAIGKACAWNSLERHQRSMAAEPVIMQNPHGFNKGGAKYDKAPTFSQRDLCEDIKTDGQLGTTGVIEEIGYATPIEWNDQGEPIKAISGTNGKQYTVYKVLDGDIAIKGTKYPIKLPDGFYIIRKLTVKECARLQTMPDDYCKAVSDTQAYKALGNGWTAEVIIHILSNALKDVPKDEEIVVLSMYDGIGTGRYCLDKMGFTNVRYYAYEIDKYAIQVAKDNYPDIVECGDAFGLRAAEWSLPI